MKKSVVTLVGLTILVLILGGVAQADTNTPSSDSSGNSALPATVIGSALVDPLITFSEFPVGTLISTQYAGLGVTFSGAVDGLPIIANDAAIPTSPVLSPNPPFAGTFNINFPSGATNVQFTSGFWNTIGSGVITVFNPSNVVIATLTDTSIGIDTFNLTALGTIGHITFDSRNDPAGADIDNLQFQTPEPSSFLLIGARLFAFLGTRRLLKLQR